MPKKKAGRPKEYTAAFIEKEAEALEKWIADPNHFWLGDFAAQRGYHRQRLSEFAKANAKFSDALKKAKQIQENRLFKKGLRGKYNPTLVIFALKNVAGWRDKKEVEHAGKLAHEVNVPRSVRGVVERLADKFLNSYKKNYGNTKTDA